MHELRCVLPPLPCYKHTHTQFLTLIKGKHDIYFSKSEKLEYVNISTRKKPKDDLS